MDDTYLTISSISEGLFKDKGSKFIARAYPIEREDQVKEILNQVRKEYYDARHHCYAWVLGFDQSHFRMNDDGEPAGTAGRPIYGQLLSAGITNVLIIVTRYFGGTKLGIRGLINAYKGAAQDAISQASIVRKVRESSFQLAFDYAVMNDVMKIVKEYDLKILQHTYDQSCLINFSVRMMLETTVIRAFGNITGLTINKL